MKSFRSKLLALGYSWIARLVGYARIASVVSILVSAVAHADWPAAESVPDGAPAAVDAKESGGDPAPVDVAEPVYRHDLSGPRMGATYAPNGLATSQFGWHFENQASPSPCGPWFLVERVFLVGGLENSMFVPTGTLVFGIRLPSSFEFGVGPSMTAGAGRGLQSSLVVAAGQSFRAGGIRVPVNVACTLQRGGEQRWTLITGWAIRDRQ